MTEQELHDIQARANAATAAPWRNRWRDLAAGGQHDTESVIVGPDYSDTSGGDGIVVGLLYYDGDHAAVREPDADFIAAARQDVPALVAEVRKLQGLIKQAEWAVNSDGDPACPWCGFYSFDHQHAATCPAFPPSEDP